MAHVQASYGSVLALHDVTIHVPSGQIIALLGANGAGKSSTLRAISGLLRPSHGTIEFDGCRIDRLSPDRIVRMGISQVPEGRQLFSGLTVMENLRLGAHLRSDRAGIKRDLERVFSYFPLLEARTRQAAGLLSGGEQQMLAIARALMAGPRLLLLDEPSLGLAPIVVRDIFRIIKGFNDREGLTILIVEQNANLALNMAHYGYLLETGGVLLHGTSQDLRADPSVRRGYLGERSAAR